MKYGICIAVCAALSAAPAFSANLITNGGFEADAVGSSTISAWQVALGAGDGIDVTSGQGYQSCCASYGSAASLANQFIAFGGGDSGNAALISQSFNTTASLYTVSFDTGAFGGEQTITATAFDALTNAVLGTLSVTAPGTNNFDSMFTTSFFSFLGAGNAVKLSFTAAGSATRSRDAFLDNVSVIGAAVPEPASWVMMLGGFGLIGGALRSSRRTSVSFG